MSATGLGVVFWNDMLTAGTGSGGSGLGLYDTGNPAGPTVSTHLLFLAQDHDYAITKIFLSATVACRVRFGVKISGFPLASGDDGRKVFTVALDPTLGNPTGGTAVLDLAVTIPISGSYGLIGIADVGYGPGFDAGVWAAISGEVRD